MLQFLILNIFSASHIRFVLSPQELLVSSDLDNIYWLVDENTIEDTWSVCPSNVLIQSPDSTFQIRTVLSIDPDTTFPQSEHVALSGDEI